MDQDELIDAYALLAVLGDLVAEDLRNPTLIKLAQRQLCTPTEMQTRLHWALDTLDAFLENQP